jgi:PPOX class probable FMN-dependent enzyme
MAITDEAALRALYGEIHPRAAKKIIDRLDAHCLAFIAASPFMLIATSDGRGLDVSPRGDPAGSVVVEDDRHLLVADRPGNNRIDNLLNIIADSRVSLLFIVPGIGETLRVNGRAEISNDPELLQSFAVNDKPPRTVLIVSIEAVYFHCSKALVRSKLWDPAQHIARGEMPSAGAMIAAVSEEFDAAAYDRELPERVKKSLY